MTIEDLKCVLEARIRNLRNRIAVMRDNGELELLSVAETELAETEATLETLNSL